MSEQSGRTAWILWVAMLGALANYAIIAAFTEVQHDMQHDDGMPMLLVAMAVAAAMMTAASLLLAPVLGRMMHSFWVYYVARLLFAESIAVFALILAFMGAAPLVSLAFGGVSLALLLIAAPTAGHREAALKRL